VNCRGNVHVCDRSTSVIPHILSIVVDLEFRILNAFGCKWSCIEMIYWLTRMAICTFADDYWAYDKCSYNSQVKVNGASMIIRLTPLAIKTLHRHIPCKWNYWPLFQPHMKATCSLPHPRNDLQWHLNHNWSCKSDNKIETWSLLYIVKVFPAVIA
jgi:hypothetical protein